MDYSSTMFSSRADKLEKRIKDLNALMAEYRKEMDEAEKRFHKREIGRDEADRIHKRCQSKIESIGHKVRECRSELEALG